MPVPQKLNITHYRGDTLGMLVRLWEDAEKTTPSDLSASVVTAQVRVTTETPIIGTFDVTVATNEITMVLDPLQSADLPPACVYDIRVDWEGDGKNIQTVLAGDMTITPDVTRTP
jgi:hypothetical protein